MSPMIQTITFAVLGSVLLIAGALLDGRVELIAAGTGLLGAVLVRRPLDRE